jgi:hypothetical protein
MRDAEFLIRPLMEGFDFGRWQTSFRTLYQVFFLVFTAMGKDRKRVWNRPYVNVLGRYLMTATRPSATNNASTTSYVIKNGGSDCVGASGCRNGSFWKAYTTPTKTFR